MKKRKSIKRTIYNSGKNDLQTILLGEAKFSSIKKEKKSVEDTQKWLEKIILRWKEISDTKETILHFEDFEPIHPLIEKINFHKEIVFDVGHRYSTKIDFFHAPVVSAKPNRISEITEELRKLKLQFRQKPSASLFIQIKKLVAELSNLVDKKFHTHKIYLRRLRKKIFNSIIQDYRKRFRILVINLYNCFSDCSNSDENDNSVFINNYRNLSFNLTINNHAQQKTDHPIFRKCYY